MNHYLHFYHHHHILMCDHYHNFQVLLVFIYDLCDNYLFNSYIYIYRSIAACFNDDVYKTTTSSTSSSRKSYNDDNNDIISELINNIKYSTTICKNQLYDSIKILNKIKNTAGNVLHNILPDLEIAIKDNNKNIINKNFNIIKEWVIELTKLNSITCDVNKQCIDQIQQIFMKSTIDQLIIDKSTSTSNSETRFRFTSSSPSSVQQHSDEISTSTSHQPPFVPSDNHNSSNHHHHQQQLPRSTSADAIQKLLQVT